MKVRVVSESRHNGGVRAKRAFGSSTLTSYYAEVEGYPRFIVDSVGGKTPSERGKRARDFAVRYVSANPEIKPYQRVRWNG